MAKQIKPVEVEKTMKEKICDFVESCESGEYSLNDFLKQLYEKPTNNELPAYMQQHEAKKMRVLLSELNDEKKISFKDSGYLSLGRSYYEGVDQKQKHYTIANTQIIFEK